MSAANQHILRVLCNDRPGIVAGVTSLIVEHGGNIIDLEQHTEEHSGLFAMRIHVENLKKAPQFERSLTTLKLPSGKFFFDSAEKRQRVAVFVTKEPACLYDLLIRRQTGELPCEIPLIISNREDLAPVAEQFAIPFHCLPVDGKNNRKQEKAAAELLVRHEIDLIVLARYMRILSKDFVEERMGRMINIHHSFLPAFKGADPYRQAWERGVKMIGATAHYVTADLDEGPILHQATAQVTHQYTLEELRRTGSDLERTVLSQAVRAHLERRVLLLGKRTIVFHF